LIFRGFVYKFTISKFTSNNLQKKGNNTMYQDKKKSEKVYVESNCVSRDDCCWDETPEMITEVVVVNEVSETAEWPAHWQKQL
tara:strand:+ start:279 stop:527 length:249 start_codon:yes stop_codon:yes gene_type:complete